MRMLKDKTFARAIENNLEESPFFSYIQKVFDILDGKRFYLWGGAVRDPIVKELYGLDYETRDFDLTVDDSKERINFKKIFGGCQDMYYSRHGTPKWKPVSNLEVDIGPFSAVTIYRRKPELPINPEVALERGDITTSAIAYNMKERTVYSVGALEGIEKREVSILYEHGEEPNVIMCRLVLHGNKLRFNIGQKGINFIARRYSPKQDSYIRKYLEYKMLGASSSFVIETLERIQQEN